MNITFVCSALESGRDGVGDYCRRLGGALVGLGHEVHLIALHDKWINEIQTEKYQNLSVLRIPAETWMSQVLFITQESIRTLRPDWLSLQYVCYGFHPKGLAWRWNPLFRNLANLVPRRHLMFHELWIGQSTMRRCVKD